MNRSRDCQAGCCHRVLFDSYSLSRCRSTLRLALPILGAFCPTRQALLPVWKEDLLIFS